MQLLPPSPQIENKLENWILKNGQTANAYIYTAMKTEMIRVDICKYRNMFSCVAIAIYAGKLGLGSIDCTHLLNVGH